MFVERIKFALHGLTQFNQAVMSVGSHLDPADLPRQKLKLVICGDQRVGKSKLFDRFISDTYSEGYYTTIGSDNQQCERVIPGVNVALDIWDTSGNPQYKNVLPIFFNEADIVIVVFDVTNKKSFDMVPSFISDSKSWVNDDFTLVIFGSKIDSWKCPREVSFDEACSMATRYKCHYYETSAVTTQGLEDSLRKIIKKTLKRKNLLPDWLVSSRDDDIDMDF